MLRIDRPPGYIASSLVASDLNGLLDCVVAGRTGGCEIAVPKQLRIAAMRDDMVRNGCRDGQSLAGTALTEGLLG